MIRRGRDVGEGQRPTTRKHTRRGYRLFGLWAGRIIGPVSRLRRLVLADRFFFVTCWPLRKRRILSGSEFACWARARGRVQPKPFPATSVQTEEMLHFRRRLCEDASDWSNTLCRG